eukprot:TRINITY_DN3483_c0_g1_i1.p1 TRINITY_DN3483_c0_g1~~TRINITY_DN3483_c0_g1_i1.p1  ORF type:complete len:522 (+),score=119.69 TRINITY_DN3483_c0_g1_i1:30-1595(+)
MTDNKLNITVHKARDIKQKPNYNVYAEIIVNDAKGTKIGKAIETPCDKNNEPTWDFTTTFDIKGKTGNFSINVGVWEQHTFSRDRYLGEANFIFYPSKSTNVESWFSLQSKKNKVKVFGEVRLTVEYVGKVPEESSTTISNNNTNNNTNTKKNDPNTSATKSNDRSSLFATLIDEPFTVLQSNVIDWESLRKGPEEVVMEKFPSSSRANIINKLEVDNNSNYYGMEAVKANVVVTSGKWYYEVKMLSAGRFYIGWATTDYDPKLPSGKGDAWTYDGYSNYKRRKDQSFTYGSDYWTANDTIGCALDYEKKSIHFFKNGKDIGEAFGVSDLPKKAELVPYIDMAGYMKASVNFGSKEFSFPQVGYNTLHLKLNKTQLAKLESRFQHYNKIVIEAEYEDENLIHDEGLDQLQKDLGIDSDTDIGFFILAYKLDCHDAWQISLEEWMNGFLSLGCDGMTKIKESLPKWRKELEDPKKLQRLLLLVVSIFQGQYREVNPFRGSQVIVGRFDQAKKSQRLPLEVVR